MQMKIGGRNSVFGPQVPQPPVPSFELLLNSLVKAGQENVFFKKQFL